MKINSVIIFINRFKNIVKNRLGRQPVFYQFPNKFAPKLHLDIKENYIKVNGYQKYIIYKNKIIPDRYSYDLMEKYKLLKKVFKEDLSGKTYLDLGANSGFFTFYAHQQGAECKAIDMDSNYINILDKISRYFDYNIIIDKINIADYKKPADIVIALSLIHWIYSCTSIYGSMEELVNFFRSITKEYLIIEWIDPLDEAIQYFNHLEYNINFSDSSYNHEEFLKQLKKYFSSIELLGKTRHNTRMIYKVSV